MVNEPRLVKKGSFAWLYFHSVCFPDLPVWDIVLVEPITRRRMGSATTPKGPNWVPKSLALGMGQNSAP